MDQQEHSQPQVSGIVSGMPQLSYAPNAYAGIPGQGSLVASVVAGQASGQAVGVQLGEEQHANQLQQSELEQRLQSFWANQRQGIETLADFRSHSLPYARIKKIMKADEDVKMVSAEAPIVFAKACEMFISELTLRAWNHAEGTRRRTIQKNDVAAAIARAEVFDFLADVVKDDEPLSVPENAVPLGESSGSLPYYHVQPLQMAPARAPDPGLAMNRHVIDPTL